ncbi:MAG: LamG domain-containing protein, partial [Chitinophagaceae bacterium]
MRCKPFSAETPFPTRRKIPALLIHLNQKQTMRLRKLAIATIGVTLAFGANAQRDAARRSVSNNNTSSLATAHTAVSVGAGALKFDGSNDYVRVSDNALLDFGTGDFTVEAWVKKNASSVGFSNSSVMGKWNTGAIPGSNEWLLSVSSTFNGGTNDRPMILIETDQGSFSAESTTNIALGTWYHLAGVRQGSSLQLYVNGSLVATTTLPSGAVLLNAGRDLDFGAFRFHQPGQPVIYSNVEIDEARIWSRGLCAEEISTYRSGEPPLPQRGLTAYYRFNQGSAGGTNTGVTTLTDASGNSLNGSLQNFALTGSTSNWVSGTVSGTASVYSATISYAGTPYAAGPGTASVTLTGTTGGSYSSTTGLVIDASTGAVDLATSTPGTYTVTYTIAPGGCLIYSTNTQVTISNPFSAFISYPGSPYCSSTGTASVFFSGTNGGTFTSAPGLSIDASTGAIDLATSTAGTYTVRYGTSPTDFTTTEVSVRPATFINTVPNMVLCNGAPSGVITLSGAAGLTFNWSASNPAIGIASSGTGSIASFTASNNGVTPLQSFVSVYPSGGTGCDLKRNMIFRITVNPTPVISAVADQTLCAGTMASGVNFVSS